MFEFFFTKKKAHEIGLYYYPFQTIEVDIHSHLIPGIDDGAPDVKTAIELVRNLRDLGFKKIITTPHVSELYPNTINSVLDGLIQLKNELNTLTIDVEITVAAEYMINDVFEEMLVSNSEFLTLPQNHILVEMPHFSEPLNLHRVISLLVAKGFTPVIAHPERYRHYNGNLLQYKKLKDYGCTFQVNLLSILGYYGQTVRDCAWLLLNNRMIEFIGSDVHHSRHIDFLKINMPPECQHLINNYPFQNKNVFKTRDAVLTSSKL